MRILLVNPPIPESYYNREYYLPLSLLYLAAVIRKNGDEPEILDLKIYSGRKIKNFEDFHKNKIISSVGSFKPDMIGFGCLYSGQFPEILSYAGHLKKNFKGIPIVLGGIHPTLYPREILSNCKDVDFIIIGEGEESFVKFINAYKSGRMTFENINGLAYRSCEEIRVNPKTCYIEDLDTLPFPAYDLVDMKGYYVDTSAWANPKKLSFKTTIPLISSRSCPNKCNFCSMYHVMGPKWRSRSPKNVVDEIEMLYKEYGFSHLSFMDDNLTLKRSHILDVCKMIKERELDIEFETPNGVSIRTLDKEVLDAMVSAGLTRLALAIESGSDFIRNKVMGKHLQEEKILDVIGLTKQYKDLYVRVFFIIGMPEETQGTLEATYNMIKKIDVDRIYLHNIIPYPGTAVYQQALRDGLFVDVDPENFYKTDNLFLTNYDTFFIKPYKLTIPQLVEFRKKCKVLIDEMSRMKKGVKAGNRDER